MTDDAAERYRAFAHSAATSQAYRSTMRRLERWFAPGDLPATVDQMAAWIAALADSGLAATTVKRHVSAARWLTLEGDFAADPAWVGDHGIRQTVSGVTHLDRSRPRRRADGITPAEAARMAQLAADDGSLTGLRDAAVILTMSVLLLRRGEAAALDRADYTRAGRLVRLRWSKTDQGGRGWEGRIGPRAAAAVDAWIDGAGIRGGPLWRPVRDGSVLGSRLATASIATAIGRRAAAAGIDDGRRITAHSLRRGSAQAAIDAGVPLAMLMDAGRWSTETVAAHYASRSLRAQADVADMLDAMGPDPQPDRPSPPKSNPQTSQ